MTLDEKIQIFTDSSRFKTNVTLLKEMSLQDQYLYLLQLFDVYKPKTAMKMKDIYCKQLYGETYYGKELVNERK